MQNPNNPKTKRTTKVLIAILVSLAIIIAALCATPFVLAATVREFRTINDVPAPTQTKVEVGTATVSGSGWKDNMRYLASYEIQGLVVGLDDYNSDSLYDRAAPRDLSIAWGDMAAHSNLIVWLRGQREMSAEITKMSEWIIGKKAERNRKILRRRLIDGICYEPLAEEFDMSVRQIKNIVYKSEEIIFRHL